MISHHLKEETTLWKKINQFYLQLQTVDVFWSLFLISFNLKIFFNTASDVTLTLSAWNFGGSDYELLFQ
jgi:hypothetical protein